MGRRHKWRPRASSMGYYLLCPMRALWDKWAYEDEEVPPRTDTPYTALGTVAHFIMQEGVRAVFPGPAADHAPHAEEIELAAKLFGGSVEKMRAAAQAAALRAASHLPEIQGRWFAEEDLKAKDLSGHIDFRAEDESFLVDLKTTTKLPPGRQIKAEHLGQLYSYRLLVEERFGYVPRYGRIIYVHSMGGQWSFVPPDIDFHSQEALAYADGLKGQIRMLRSKELEKWAFPRLSPMCKDLFCGYYAECHAKLMPSRGGQMSGSTDSDICLDAFKGGGISSLKEVKL